MKTILLALALVLAISACSNSTGGGTVAPEEEAHPEIVGKWYKHDIGSDPHNIEYWRLSSTTNSLTTGLIARNINDGSLTDSVYRYCKFNGTWNGNTFRGSYQRPVDNGTRFIGEFMQITFTGSTISGFWVDSSWAGSYPHVEFDGYKL